MELFNTEIYLSDLTDETKDQLIEVIIDRLKDDEEYLKEIEEKIDKEIKEDKEFIDLKALTREDRIKMVLEDEAKEVLNDTFFGEISIGD